jgi:uncharacterized protein (TIGR03118 family)
MSQGPTTPVWVSDNGMNVTTLYRGDGVVGPVAKVPLTVTIPGDGPTGQVFNPTTGFVVSDGNGHSGPALFIFASESGDITGWNPNVPPPMPSTQAQGAVHTPDAVYKGLAMATLNGSSMLYAANFRSGHIDVFDDAFKPFTTPGNFRDPHLPKGYAPFNVAAMNGKLFVTFAQQDSAKHDEVDGQGKGFLDVFDTAGHFLRRLVTRGQLNAPWGMTMAPDGFGQFSGDLLVGNFGDGRIFAYDLDGHLQGALRNAKNQRIVVDGLWGLMFGNGTTASNTTLLFSAGPDGENHGLFGTITVAPPKHNN